MIRQALELVERAHGLLQQIEPQPIYAGGVAVALLLPPEAAATCKTKDLDCLFEARTYAELEAVHDQLRLLGAQPDTREDAPNCRWILADVTLDVLAPFADAPGPHNEWHAVDKESTVSVALSSGAVVRVLDAPHLIASKVLAFRSPHRADAGDWYASKDYEDIVTLLDGVDFEAALQGSPAELQAYLAGFLREVATDEEARWAMEGHLAGVHPGQAGDVTEFVMTRIRDWLRDLGEIGAPT